MRSEKREKIIAPHKKKKKSMAMLAALIIAT